MSTYFKITERDLIFSSMKRDYIKSFQRETGNSDSSRLLLNYYYKNTVSTWRQVLRYWTNLIVLKQKVDPWWMLPQHFSQVSQKWS